MKKTSNLPETINSISDLHRKMALPRPEHPLVSLIDLQDIQINEQDWNNVVLNYYNICLKKNVQGKMKYGQHYYDFDEGLLSFISPGQVVSVKEGDCESTGLLLIFHPDLVRNYPLGETNKELRLFLLCRTRSPASFRKGRNHGGNHDEKYPAGIQLVH